MKYRRLGRSGLKVSEVALGSWITLGYKVGADDSTRIAGEAFEAGINFFDTADVYAGGEAERILGKALAGIPRKDLVVASKCFFPMSAKPNDQGLSRKHVVESCEASLQRLGLDYLDLYQCHRFDPDTPLEETLRALDHLQQTGKILYYGVSEWTAVQIADACHLARSLGFEGPVSNQPVYNLLQRKIEPQILPVCQREGIGNVVFSPLAQGVLTGKYKGGKIPPDSRAADDRTHGFVQRYLDADSLARADRLVGLAEKLGTTPARLALAYCLRRCEVSSVIIGATKLEQLRDNVGASDLEISPEIWDQLEDAGEE
jgi:voltage-dependent potassium channel beta subunit